MKNKIFKFAKYALITLLVLFLLLAAVIGVRLYFSPKLQPWHTFVPDELTAAELDKATWADYIARENKIFEDVRREVVLKIPESEKTPLNRYYEGSRIYPGNFKEDWNRSYILIPQNPKGAVVLLHGLTDAPYSLRHIAEVYYKEGFAVVGLRKPGHGTVPAALTKITRHEWIAAVRLAVREARKLAPEGAPLHIAGFSQGGSLALKYTLDAVENDQQAPDKLILISPMVGITRFSRLAEILAIPSFLPGFEKAEWLSIIPEFNPFKYNSFPVNAVKQARLLTTDIQRQIQRLHADGRINNMPQITTFQSIVDYTVSTPAIINNLYNFLPANTSELIIFDINRDTVFMPLVRPVFINMMSKMLPDFPQDYKITIIGNASPGDPDAVERTVLPGGHDFIIRKLGLPYPQDVFSLSHISLPFPQSDPLYGSAPDPESENEFGLNLGLIANAQGERGVLEINTNLFFRISSNPLFPYVADRVREIIRALPPPHGNIDIRYDAGSKTKITQKEYDAAMKESGYSGAPF